MPHQSDRHPFWDPYVDISGAALKEQLINQRKVPIYGDINGESVEKIISVLEQLAYKEAAPILLLINTTGGDGRYAFHLKDAIDSIDSEVCGLVTLKAYSAGLDILQMCSKRKARPNAEFFLHPTSRSLDARIGISRREYSDEEKIAFFDRLLEHNDRRVELLVESSDLSEEDVYRLFEMGEYLDDYPTAEHMLKWGFIDEIAENFKLLNENWSDNWSQ